MIDISRKRTGRQVAAVVRGHSSTFCILAMLVGSLISILLRSAVPIGFGASPFDEALYVREGLSIARGHWLGPFNDLTLAKGPAYPTFIAWTHNIGVPVKIGEQLTYLFAGLCVAGCVWIVTRRHVLATVIFLIFAFDPASFSVTSADMLRDSWYASLSLLFLASLFLAVYGAVTRVRIVWVMLAGSIAGVSGAAFWLCREEGAWILPSALVIVLGLPLYRLASWWRRTPDKRADRRRLIRRAGRVGIVMAVIGSALLTPIVYVRAANHSHYGTTFVSDVASGEFARAYADWSTVRAGKLIPLIPISRQQLEAVYRVSSDARELQPYLEDPQNPLCFGHKHCEYAGAFMGFALRDAAASAGHFHSEREAQSFFGQLSQQIHTACQTRKLTCTSRLPTSLQPLQRASWHPILNSFVGSFGSVILSTNFFTLPNSAPIRYRALRDETRAVVSGIPATQAAAVAQIRNFSKHTWPYDLLGAIYQPLLPLLLVLALTGVAIDLGGRRKHRFALVILCGAFAVGVLSRLVLLAIVDTTEFSTRGANLPRLQLPTRALLLAFAVVGTSQLVEVARARMQSGRAPPEAPPALVADDSELYVDVSPGEAPVSPLAD